MCETVSVNEQMTRDMCEDICGDFSGLYSVRQIRKAYDRCCKEGCDIVLGTRDHTSDEYRRSVMIADYHSLCQDEIEAWSMCFDVLFSKDPDTGEVTYSYDF